MPLSVSFGMSFSMRKRGVPLNMFDPPSTPKAPSDLLWVDEFIRKVKPYIFIRTEDNILIKRPNQAIKVNPTGAKMLDVLLKGTSIKTILKKIRTKNQQTETASFLWAIRNHLEGNLGEFCPNPALEREYFDLNFSQYPILSELAITNRCNLSCRFCYASCGCSTGKPSNHMDMSLRDAKKIIQKIYRNARVPSISFTGGEPTLIPILPDLIAYAKKLGMRVNLITNGTLINQKMAARLAEAGLDSAQVSLEGISPETHDSLVGMRGAFGKSLAGARHLKEEKITVHTNTTINKLNLKECGFFPVFVKKELGFSRFSMNLMIPSGSGSSQKELWVFYHQIGDVLETIQKNSQKENVEFMWYSPVPMCMFNSIAHGMGNKGCAACDGLLSVTPEGNVIPCSSLDDPVGNLLRQDFMSIWESAKARKYREKKFAHVDCQSCSDFVTCHGACPIYWDTMTFKELIPFLKLEGNKHDKGSLS